jgi:hypothetical protein
MTTCRLNKSKSMKIVELGEPCRNQPRALALGDNLCERQVFSIHFADNNFSNLWEFSDECCCNPWSQF